MPAVVVIHHLKNFDEWFKQFKTNPPPKIGRWRVMRGSNERSRVHVVGEMAASEVQDVKAFFESAHIKEVIQHANAMSTKPIEIVWLDELTL